MDHVDVVVVVVVVDVGVGKAGCFGGDSGGHDLAS